MALENNGPYLVLFPKKNDIYCYPTYKKLITSFPSEIPYFTKALLIDSKLELHKIRNAGRVGWGNSFWGITLFWKERLIRLELKIDENVTISLDEAKSILGNAIETKPFGRFMTEFFGTKKKLMSAINNVTTTTELMNLFL